MLQRLVVAASAALSILLSACAVHPPVQAQAAPPVGTGGKQSAGAPAGFAAWLDKLRAQAAARGIAANTLATAFDHAQYLPDVIEHDRRQPEFTRSIWDYLDTAVSQRRIETGRQRLMANRATADKIAAQYGVPANILVAIWGIESNYGQNFGHFETIDALATLGFEGRRRDWARKQLFAALQILADGDIDRAQMRGSWAGAMGHTQFLPENFLRYAVDEDGDGRRDIWGSIPDVLASTANYLADAGWQSGEPWGVEVRLPKGFDYSQAELAVTKSTQAWAAEGVTGVRGQPLPGFAQASVIVPAGAHGPAFLVGPNFKVILRYNNAQSYALAVGRLADRIAGASVLAQSWPRGLATMSRDQVRQMQAALNARGFDTGGAPDGLVGPNTRAALRAYQRSIGVIPDGFPTLALLQRLLAGK